MSLKIKRGLRNFIKFVLFLACLILIAIFIRILIWENTYYSSKTTSVRSSAPTIITSLALSSSPSEEAPSKKAFDDYQVSAIAPRYLNIPRLNVRARILASSANLNTMPVSENIYDACWYSGSSSPGKNNAGATLISGLAKGDTKAGIFANLSSLEIDDTVSIETGDGTNYEYLIKELNFIAQGDASKKLPELTQNLDQKETLSLITSKKIDNTDAEETIIIVRAIRKN